MDQVFDAFEQIPVTENMIGQLHQDLLRYSTKDERHRGHYKTLPNHFPDHESLTLGQLVQLTGGKPSTLKLRLKELVETGYIIPKGQGRGAHYVRA